MDLTTPTTSSMLIFCVRKPGTTFNEFQMHYESQHVPLLSRLIMHGDLRPLSHTREYIKRDDDTKASFPFGGAETFEYDCISRLVFRDTQQRDALLEEFGKHAKELSQDEERFLDRSKSRIVYVGEAKASVRRD